MCNSIFFFTIWYSLRNCFIFWNFNCACIRFINSWYKKNECATPSKFWSKSKRYINCKDVLHEIVNENEIKEKLWLRFIWKANHWNYHYILGSGNSRRRCMQLVKLVSFLSKTPFFFSLCHQQMRNGYS